MLRTAILSLLVPTALIACKPRSDQSAVRSAEGESGDGSAVTLTWAEVHTRFQRDIKSLEDGLLAGGGDLKSVEGLALTDAGFGDAIEEAKNSAETLRELSKETILSQRADIEKVALELDAMIQLIEIGAQGADVTDLREAVVRVRKILDAPPEVAPKKYTPPYLKPAKQPEVDYTRLTCKTFPDGSTLPMIVDNGQVIGYRSNDGGKGFNNADNCWNAVNNVRNGFVCTLASNGSVAPFNVRTNTQFGPPKAFVQTKNCVNAVAISRSDAICLVDNSPGVNQYAMYGIPAGNAVDWWFDTAEKCMARDKSPDPRTICRENAEKRYQLCLATAKYISESLKQSNARLECILKNMKERDACD